MSRKRKCVLVTGANGFLGRHVVPALLEQGYEVRTLGRSESTNPDLRHYRTDLANGVPEEAMRGVDAVVHLASDVSIARSIADPSGNITTNLAMALAVLKACGASKNKPLLVFLSTDRVYGKGRGRVTEQSPTFPIEPYTASKIMGEIAVATYANLFDMPYITLRASAFFGPHQSRRSFIADVIQKMMENDEITVGPLNAVKNFTYAGNVAAAVLAAISAPRSAQNRVYNVGGKPISLLKVLGLLKTIVEKKLRKRIRIRIDRSIRLPQKNEIGTFALSTASAHKLLKWKETISLEKGLGRTVDYFLAPENK